MRAANDTENGSEANYPGNSDACLIYIYLKGYLMGPEDVIQDVEVNGVSLGPLVNTDAYLLTAVPAGIVVVWAAYFSGRFTNLDTTANKLDKQVSCSGRQSIFMRYDTYAGFWAALRWFPSLKEGPKLVVDGGRWLTTLLMTSRQPVNYYWYIGSRV